MISTRTWTLVALVLSSICAFPQSDRKTTLSASATVPIVAIKRGEIQLSVRTIPVAFDTENGPNSSLLVPLTSSWNVSPQEVSGFEVIGYFDRAEQALISTSGDVSSQLVLGRIRSEPFRRFSETNMVGPANGSLRLFSQPITDASRRGIRHDILELALDGSVQQSATHYTGVLHLEARYF